jgi:hypothetical protein
MSVQTITPTPTVPATTRTTITRVVTLHPDTSVSMQVALLEAIEATLRGQGAERIWVDPDCAQLVVLAEVRGD